MQMRSKWDANDASFLNWFHQFIKYFHDEAFDTKLKVSLKFQRVLSSMAAIDGPAQWKSAATTWERYEATIIH